MDSMIMRRIILPLLAGLLLASCDDGSVTDPVYVDSSTRYEAILTANLSGLDQWDGTGYSVALAAFKDGSRYSVIQKSVTSGTVVMTSIPVTVNTVELAVVDALRQRVATIAKYQVEEGHDEADTIRLDLGDISVSPYGAVDAAVFNNTSLNCVRCHTGESAAGGLVLSGDDAYANLVGVASAKEPGQMRVKPGDAADSFLYKVITEGDPNVHYSHPQLFTEDGVAPLVDLVKMWIDGGAVK